MNCYNCKCNLIIEVSKDDNIDANKIACKYRDYDLCSVCKENLIYFGFLGDIDNPVLNYEPEKVKLNHKKFKKKK
tara:strand:+ start:465 stop:689 length:225 start_codon:yes stop_codon:yes gene_type:complete